MEVKENGATSKTAIGYSHLNCEADPKETTKQQVEGLRRHPTAYNIGNENSWYSF